MGNIREVQKEQAEWAERNFGKPQDREQWHPLLGIVEEVGELSHAVLKAAQGIRRNEDHYEGARDAIGDIVIFLLDYCTLRGWDLEDIVTETWTQVKERDWRVG